MSPTHRSWQKTPPRPKLSKLIRGWAEHQPKKKIKMTSLVTGGLFFQPSPGRAWASLVLACVLLRPVWLQEVYFFSPATDELGQVWSRQCVLPRPVGQQSLFAAGPRQSHPDAGSLRQVPSLRVLRSCWTVKCPELKSAELVAYIRHPDDVGMVRRQTDVADTQVAVEHTAEAELVQAHPALGRTPT